VALGQGLEESSLSLAIKGTTWAIPLLQSIHIVTIGVVFVSSLMIALRVMGTMRADEPFVAVWRRFAPWMWYGLVVMAVTGVLLVIGEPIREFTALSFWLKMTLLAIAVISTFVFGRTFAPRGAAPAGAGPGASAGTGAAYAGVPGSGSGVAYADVSGGGAHAGVSGGGAAYAAASSAEFSVGAKLVAAGIIVLWLAIIFLGRAIAYDVEVWGSLSLHGG
jgi:uncharacterized protein DUF6644